MKILIIGGAGFIGSVLTEEFLKNGHEVTVLDILRRGSKGIIQHKDNRNFTLINTDFMNGILPSILGDIDIVIHLAAIVGDPACEAQPILATKTNIEGTKIVVDACNDSDIKGLFFASTASVYGANPEVCTEESKLNPLSYYARTKVEAEKIILQNSRRGIIFRFGTMYGLSPNMRFDIIVNRLVQDAIKKGECNVYDGKQYRGFIHPKDLAYFFMYLFEKDLIPYSGRIYNLISENLSMLQIGQLIKLLLPYIHLKLTPEKEDNRTYICSSFKAYLELGFSPQVRVRDGIREMELYLLRERNGYNVPISGYR